MPPVRNPLLPAELSRLPPQDLHLVRRVLVMPQTVSQHLARSGLGIDESQSDARIAHRAKRGAQPVDLIPFLPGDDVESTIVLVGEYESHVIVVRVVVDIEGALVIDTAENVRSLVDEKKSF